MAVLYVTEFANVGTTTQYAQPMQVTAQPNIAEQTVAIGAGSVASSAFNANTRLVKLHTDAICSVKFGTAPTATATTMRMAANESIYFAVPANQAYKVAVITNT